MVNSPLQNPFENVNCIGIALKKVHPMQNHIGILYKDGAEVYIFHRNTYDMKAELATNDYCWLDLAGEFVDRDRAYLNAELLSIVASSDSKPIAYGLDAPVALFNEHGDYDEKFVDHGFTCATFVLSVFEARGYSLLSYSDWPQNIECNIEWQTRVVRWISSSDSVQGNAQARLVGSRRFLPQEVAASTQLELGCSYLAAARLGIEIDDCLVRIGSLTFYRFSPESRGLGVPYRHFN